MKVINASWYEKPAGITTSTSCGGVVVRIKNGRILVAMVREDPASLPVLPKGHQEEGETLQQAAIREIEEEAGLSELTYVSQLGTQERLDYSKSVWKTIHYFLFSTNQAQGKPTDKSRDYEVEWHELRALPTMFWPEQRKLLDDNRELIERALR